MKHLLTFTTVLCSFLILILALSSCSKKASNLDSNIPAEVYIKCKLKGNLIEFHGRYASNTGGTSLITHNYSGVQTEYILTGTNGPQTNILGLQFFTDTLRSQLYYSKYVQFPFVANATGIQTDTATYGINRQGDSIRIDITRYSNGSIDGYFSGRLTSRKIAGGAIVAEYAADVTEGEFKNLSR